MRFTIRELLLVTVIVGMGVGWWIERSVTSQRVAEDAKLYDACITELRSLVEELRYPQHGVHLHPSIFDVPLKVADKAQARLKKTKQ